MARCTDGRGGGCRQPITPSQRLVHEVRNERGQLVGVLHNKCWFAARKREGGTERPTAYEESARHQTVDDATAEARARREASERALAAAEFHRRTIEARIAAGMASADEDLAATLERITEAAEQVELARHQEQLAEQRRLEETPREWNDWRGGEGTGSMEAEA